MTLLELLAVLAALGVLLALATPSWRAAIDRQRLAAASQEVVSLLQQARWAAQMRAEPLRVELAADAACLLLHNGPAGACTCPGAAGRPGESGAACADGAVRLRSVQPPVGQALQLTASVRSMRFDPVWGTTTPAGTVAIQGRFGTVRHVVNLQGRVRSCIRPASTASGSALPGMPRCDETDGSAPTGARR